MIIVCNFNLFDKKQNIYLLYDNGESELIGSADLNSLSQILMASCIQYGITEIHLTGSKKYLNRIVKNIHEYETMTYGTNNIVIEVN